MKSFLLKKRLSHRCFPMNFDKFLRTLIEHIRWLLLNMRNIITPTEVGFNESPSMKAP